MPMERTVDVSKRIDISEPITISEQVYGVSDPFPSNFTSRTHVQCDYLAQHIMSYLQIRSIHTAIKDIGFEQHVQIAPIYRRGYRGNPSFRHCSHDPLCRGSCV